MPHIHIQHFPVETSEEKIELLLNSINEIIQKTFECKKNVISISIEPVSPDQWNEKVYIPKIEQQSQFVRQFPRYGE